MTQHPSPHLRTRPPAAVRAVLRLGRVLAGLLAACVLGALVAGVPYGLSHWIGWPLPHQVPSWQRTRDTLTGPFTDRLLLDTLACLCWIVWAVFVTDLAHALPDTLRDIRCAQPAAAPHLRRQMGPLRGLAALLLATILTGLLSLRPHPTLAPRSAAPHAEPHPSIVATTMSLERASVPIATATTPTGAHTAIVQPPHNGIHDSLWRIAQRCLGDGDRWPEIYQLNQGHLQPDGDTLTLPSLIQPGWILQLPESPTPTRPVPPTGGQTRPTTSSPGPTSPKSPADTPRPTPTHSITTAPSTQPPTSPAHLEPSGERSSQHGVDIGDGVYVSLGLAAAISASLIITRRRRRRWYTPGSGRRDDLPAAPVVRSLHLAHLRVTTPPHGDHADSPTADAEGESTPDPGDHDPAGHHPPSPPADGCIASARTNPVIHHAAGGIGLVGGGADGVARAALLDLLGAAGDTAPDVLVPATDFDTLVGGYRNGQMPRRLHIVDTLPTALDQLEAATLHRARQQTADQRPIVLIARPGNDIARLQAVLDNGATHNIGAVLLGQWRAGTSLYVGTDGIVSASYGAAAALNGARLFTVPATQTVALLTLLGEGEQDPQMQPADTADHDTDRTTLHQGTGSSQLDPTPPQPTESPPIPDTHAGYVRETADLPAGCCPPLQLRILGPVSLTWTAPPEPDSHASAEMEIIGLLSPRLRELLVLLGLHPHGISRDRVADTLWPGAPADRPHNNLATSLSRLRSGIAKATYGSVSELVLAVGGQLQLDPAVVQVDYRDLTDADTARRAAATTESRAEAWRTMTSLYRGELADGLSAEWLETPREAIRRDAIDAASRLARALVATDPQQTLDLLETARARDPYNEQLYRDIMRVQRRLGHIDAIERTLALLATRLGELDEAPSRQTIELAAALQRPTTANQTATPASATH